MKRAYFDFGAILVSGLIAGCGGVGDGVPREPVWGTITLDGRSLENGMITFTPSDSTLPAAAAVITEGSYRAGRADGPAKGAHKVCVWSQQATGKKIPSDDTPGLFIERKREIIPARYNLTSELKAEVVEGADNHFDFELKSEKPAARAKR